MQSMAEARRVAARLTPELKQALSDVAAGRLRRRCLVTTEELSEGVVVELTDLGSAVLRLTRGEA